MSFQLMAWASGQVTGSPSRKAVLMALANAANHHTGRCDPGAERIADETELHERSVRRAFVELEEAGFIRRDRKRRADGSYSTFAFTFPHLDTVSEPPDIAPAGPADTGAGNPPDIAPGQNLEGLEPGSTEPEERNTERALALVRSDGPKSVDRKPTTDQEIGLARQILTYWNLVANQDLRSHDWLSKIIMRIREYPEATADDHRLIIRTALEKPWWKGPSSPSVIYGNGAQFERSIQAARARLTKGDDDERLSRLVNEGMRRSA